MFRGSLVSFNWIQCSDDVFKWERDVTSYLSAWTDISSSKGVFGQTPSVLTSGGG